MDLLTVSAHELQAQLTCRNITSTELVKQYMEQIKTYDGYLHSVLQISPTALDQAAILDEERLSGKIRSPLHGIPILLKDNINTDPEMGMDTTSGSFALVGARPRGNAEIVDRMVEAGMVILGKANLSEMSGIKGSGVMPGWSPVGGQTQSAYTLGDFSSKDKILDHASPAGSSTGSAVAVSAGFAPLSIGTDTGGSLILPSTRAALYSLRPTVGLVSFHGIAPIAKEYDAVGPMTKSVLDLANLMDVLVKPSPVRIGNSYVECLEGGLGDIKIGALKVEDWLFPETVMLEIPEATGQIVSDINAAYEKLACLARTFQSVAMTPPRAVFPLGKPSIYDHQSAYTSFLWDKVLNILVGRFKQNFDSYLQSLESSPVRTLEEVILFNETYAKRAMPAPFDNQDSLNQAATTSISDEQHATLLAEMQSIGREHAIDKTLKDFDVDVIIGPADSSVNLIVAAAGYPSATLPLSYLEYNDRPFGLIAFTTAGGEKTLLRLMKVWEEVFPKRQPPKHLVREDE